jgi:hypothetical protein
MVFRMWRVVVNILNKHLRLFSKGWLSGDLGRGGGMVQRADSSML